MKKLWNAFMVIATGGAAGVAAFLLFSATSLGPWLTERSQHLPPTLSVLISLIAMALCAGAGETTTKRRSSVTCQIGPLRWDRNAFCRGWLITGSTGSGKTVFITRLLHDLCQKERGEKDKLGNYIEHPWGGVAIDEKGLYYNTMLGVFRTHGREKDLMLLQTKPEGAPADWKPPARFNLLSDERIPANTYANAIVKTATTIAGGEGDKGFFKTQAESNIGWAIELLRAINACQRAVNVPADQLVYPSLKVVLQILTALPDYDGLLKRVGLRRRVVVQAGEPTGRIEQGKIREEWRDDFSTLDSPKLRECMAHFHTRYWALMSSAPEQILGVQGTIYNYLTYFATDEIADVFCADNTFGFDEIDRGKVLCVAMPQKYAKERRYVCTILKLLFYQHVLRRFDDAAGLKHKNLLVCWQDEAQRFVQPDDGNVDVLREAKATTIMATQSKTSLHVPLGGKEKAVPIVLNLRNRVICRASDEECAKESADFIGKTLKMKTSKTVGPKNGNSRTYSKEEKYIVEPYQFRNMIDFTAIVVHAEGRWRSLHFSPIGVDGKEEVWWPSSQKMPPAMRLRRFFGMRPDTCRAPLPKPPKMSGS